METSISGHTSVAKCAKQRKGGFFPFVFKIATFFFFWNAFCSFTLNHFRYFRLFICWLARGHLTFLQPLSTIKNNWPPANSEVELMSYPSTLQLTEICSSTRTPISIATSCPSCCVPKSWMPPDFPPRHMQQSNIRLSLDSIGKREESNSNCMT